MCSMGGGAPEAIDSNPISWLGLTCPMTKVNRKPSGHGVLLLLPDAGHPDLAMKGRSGVCVDGDAHTGAGGVIPVWEEVNVSLRVPGVVLGERDMYGLRAPSYGRGQGGPVLGFPVVPSEAILIFLVASGEFNLPIFNNIQVTGKSIVLKWSSQVVHPWRYVGAASHLIVG